MLLGLPFFYYQILDKIGLILGFSFCLKRSRYDLLLGFFQEVQICNLGWSKQTTLKILYVKIIIKNSPLTLCDAHWLIVKSLWLLFSKQFHRQLFLTYMFSSPVISFFLQYEDERSKTCSAIKSGKGLNFVNKKL